MCCILVIGSRRRRLRLSRHFFPVNQCGFASCKKSTKISFSSFKQSFTANVNNLKRRYWYIYILTVINISYMQDAIYVVFLFFVFFLGGEWVWLNNPISSTKKKDKRKVFEELYSQHITPHVIYMYYTINHVKTNWIISYYTSSNIIHFRFSSGDLTEYDDVNGDPQQQQTPSTSTSQVHQQPVVQPRPAPGLSTSNQSLSSTAQQQQVRYSWPIKCTQYCWFSVVNQLCVHICCCWDCGVVRYNNIELFVVNKLRLIFCFCQGIQRAPAVFYV